MKFFKNKKLIKILSLIMVFSLIVPIIYFGLLSGSSKNNKINNDNTTSNISNTTALKLIDIHENVTEYSGKNVSIKGQFFLDEVLEDKFIVGVIDTLEDGEEMLFPILARMKDNNIPKDFKAYDHIEVSGIIELFDELHEDHYHTSPVIVVDTIKKIND